MSGSSFGSTFLGLLTRAERIVLDEDTRIVIISDLHMGNGGRADDLVRNEGLLSEALEQYYLPRGYTLVLNGDVEELQRFRLHQIYSRWEKLYAIFNGFHERGRLYKILGNHDEGLSLHPSYPYPVLDALWIETEHIPIFVYHGHQASGVYMRFNSVIRVLLRYLLNPLGIGNISAARNPRKRFSVERKAYQLSLLNEFISIIGHTHRSLFESLSRFDYIKFEIERLCRDFPAADGPERERIAAEVQELRRDLGKLKKKEKRNSLAESLYGDEIPVPCLFNSGSCIGKKGVTAIELTRDTIKMVYWYTEGAGKRFISRGGYPVEALGSGSRRRAELSSSRLDYVQARIALLS